MPSFVVLRSPCRIVVVVLLAWSLLPSLYAVPARGQPVPLPTLVDTVTVDPQIDEQYDTYVRETSRHWMVFSNLHVTGQREMGSVGPAFGFVFGFGYTWRRVGAELSVDYIWPSVRDSFWRDDVEAPVDLGGHMMAAINLQTSLTLFLSHADDQRAGDRRRGSRRRRRLP